MTGSSPTASYDVVFEALRGTYLEDSWVLEIKPSDHSIGFRLDLVLTPEHPDYSSPEPGEQHCYRSATLTVRSEDLIDFRPSEAQPAIDATGTWDYGNIDTFSPVNGSGPQQDWQLTGDWGTALVRAPAIAVTFTTNGAPSAH